MPLIFESNPSAKKRKFWREPGPMPVMLPNLIPWYFDVRHRNRESMLLVATLISVFNATAPDVGTPCEEALAMLKTQGLQVEDVEMTVEGVILHTMMRKQPLFFRDHINAKVALVECQEVMGGISDE